MVKMTVALKNASGSMSPLFSSTMLAQGEERNQWCQSQGLFRSPTAEKAKGEDRAMTRMVNVSGREGGGGQKRRIKERNLLFKHSIESVSGWAPSSLCLCGLS